MRAIIASILLALLTSSCVGPTNGANPLDTPPVELKRPEAIGRFGPHAQFFN